jgi:hypothetical protein
LSRPKRSRNEAVEPYEEEEEEEEEEEDLPENYICQFACLYKCFASEITKLISMLPSSTHARHFRIL